VKEEGFKLGVKESCLTVYVYHVYFVYDFLNNNNRCTVVKQKRKK